MSADSLTNMRGSHRRYVAPVPEMSRSAQMFCRSAPWRVVAGRVVLPWALQGATPKAEVLEIGCGSGAMAAALLRRYPAARMTATDFDESMVQAARSRLSSFGDRAEVRQADATALPFEDESFDLVLSFIMLHHVVRWEQAVGELVRVLRPGGRVVGYDLFGDGGGRILHRPGHVHDHEHDHTNEVRLMRRAELRQAFDDLPVDDVLIRPILGGTVGRFRAAKAV